MFRHKEEFQQANLLTVIIKDLIDKNKKADHIDLIISELSAINSGRSDWFKVNHKVYDAVNLANTMNPTLFKDSIPENAYNLLYELFSGYSKWRDEQQLRDETKRIESEKMYFVLEFMRRDTGSEFRISFLQKNHFIIHALNKDSETLDIKLVN